MAARVAPAPIGNRNSPSTASKTPLEWHTPQSVLRYERVREDVYRTLVEHASRLTLPPARADEMLPFIERELSAEEERAVVDILATRTHMCDLE